MPCKHETGGKLTIDNRGTTHADVHPALLTLPPELLLLVLSHLPLHSIEPLALTFSGTLLPLCLSLLGPRISSARNRRRMLARFDQPISESASASRYRNPRLKNPMFKPLPARQISAVGCQQVGLDPRQAPYGCKLHPTFEHLDLRDDLHWLQPLPPELALHRSDFYDNCGLLLNRVSLGRLEALQEQARQLHLRLPPAFVKYVGNPELQARVYDSGRQYVSLGKRGLSKCSAWVDGGAGGYVVCFAFGSMRSYYTALYLDGESGHCVLDLDCDLDGSSPDGEHTDGSAGELAEMHEGRNWFLGGFEDWLATIVMEGQLTFCKLMRRGGVIAGEQVREYVAENYHPVSW